MIDYFTSYFTIKAGIVTFIKVTSYFHKVDIYFYKVTIVTSSHNVANYMYLLSLSILVNLLIASY